MLPFQHYHVFTEFVEEFFGSLFLPDRLVFRPRLSHRTASHRDKLREGPKGTRHDVVCGFGRGHGGSICGKGYTHSELLSHSCTGRSVKS